MPPKFKRIGTVFTSLLLLFAVWGVQGNTLIRLPDKNVSKVQVRSFDGEALQNLKADDDFQYASEIFLADSFWDRFWLWVWQLLGRTLENEGTSTALMYFAIAIGIAVVVFVILKLTGMDLMQILTGKSASVEVPYSESLENIHEINFDQSIQQAVSSGNFRLAVRLHYLKTLKKLSDSGFIDWQLNKTNSVYINEIKHPENRAEFFALTQQFEFIWYGEFFLEGSRFQQVENSFKNFMNRI